MDIQNDLLLYLVNGGGYTSDEPWIVLYSMVDSKGKDMVRNEVLNRISNMKFSELYDIYNVYYELSDIISTVLVQRTFKNNKIPQKYLKIKHYVPSVIQELYNKNITSGQIFDEIKEILLRQVK